MFPGFGQATEVTRGCQGGRCLDLRCTALAFCHRQRSNHIIRRFRPQSHRPTSSQCENSSPFDISPSPQKEEARAQDRPQEEFPVGTDRAVSVEVLVSEQLGTSVRNKQRKGVARATGLTETQVTACEGSCYTYSVFGLTSLLLFSRPSSGWGLACQCKAQDSVRESERIRFAVFFPIGNKSDNISRSSSNRKKTLRPHS